MCVVVAVAVAVAAAAVATAVAIAAMVPASIMYETASEACGYKACQHPRQPAYEAFRAPMCAAR